MRDRILAAGQRITPQRDLIAEVLERSDRPLSAQELCDAVGELDARVGRATVFRTLQSFQDAGIVECVTLAGGHVAYLACPTSGHHHHLVCQRCREIEDLDETEVMPFLTALETDHAFGVDHSSFTIYGTCASCAASPTRSGGAPGPRRRNGQLSGG